MKKQIVWVERYPESIKEIIKNLDLESKFDIKIFRTYCDATAYLERTSKNVSFIISCYQTATSETLEIHPDDGKTCFNFYNSLQRTYAQVKFIMFSRMDNLLEVRIYSKSKNFKFIHKDHPSLLKSELQSERTEFRKIFNFQKNYGTEIGLLS